MTDTSQELAEQSVHEQRMRDDIEYAKQFIVDKMEFYLNNEGDFIGLNARYEFVDMGQVMRALRSLDQAIMSFNVYEKYADIGVKHRINIESIFTSLSNIQKNLTEAVKHEYLEKNK